MSEYLDTLSKWELAKLYCLLYKRLVKYVGGSVDYPTAVYYRPQTVDIMEEIRRRYYSE